MRRLLDHIRFLKLPTSGRSKYSFVVAPPPWFLSYLSATDGAYLPISTLKRANQDIASAMFCRLWVFHDHIEKFSRREGGRRSFGHPDEREESLRPEPNNTSLHLTAKAACASVSESSMKTERSKSTLKSSAAL